MALGVSETSDNSITTSGAWMGVSDSLKGSKFNRYKDITKNQSSAFAFFDMSYTDRRDYLRNFAQDNEINFILNTISNESIVQDKNGYFAYLDLDKLKLALNKSYNDPRAQMTADKLIEDCKRAFDTVYTCFGWESSADGWNYYKKFLIEGFLAFEIIVDDPKNPTSIIAFKEIDPSTLEPEIHMYEGQEVQVWYQYRGDAERQRIIPDANIIYISWAGMNFSSHSRISYLEGLVRPLNILRQLENSHVIWNVQNSQKRIKISVPVGTMTDSKAQQRVSEFLADWNEEVVIDDASGEVTVNGYPKFSYSKTYVIPQRGEGGSTTIEEIGGEGYDMNTTESLQYFYRKFILESEVPVNRFPMNISSPPSNPLNIDASITREEYMFSRFIQRIRGIYKEILLKPLWVQICLMHPEIAKSDYLKSCLGIVFNEENLFTMAKKRAIVNEGASIVGTLAGITDPVSQKPVFAIEWLIKEFMGLTDVDLEMNRQYMKKSILADIERQKLIKKHMEQQPPATSAEGGEAADGGGFGSGAGGGFDTGGFGGGTGGGFGNDAGTDSGFGFEDAGPEAAAAPEQAAPAGDEGGFGE